MRQNSISGCCKSENLKAAVHQIPSRRIWFCVTKGEQGPGAHLKKKNNEKIRSVLLVIQGFKTRDEHLSKTAIMEWKMEHFSKKSAHFPLQFLKI